MSPIDPTRKIARESEEKRQDMDWFIPGAFTWWAQRVIIWHDGMGSAMPRQGRMILRIWRCMTPFNFTKVWNTTDKRMV